MNLKDLLDSTKWVNVKKSLMYFYPLQRNNLKGYQEVFKVLRTLTPELNDIKIEVLMEDKADNNNAQPIIMGKLDDTENICLGFETWEKWLGMNIPEKLIKQYSSADILAMMLYEMTFFGYTQETIAKAFEEI
jgi:hypothetical protein